MHNPVLMPSASWELVWEVHNLPVRPGRAHIDVLEHVQLAGSGSRSGSGYVFLGRSGDAETCANLSAAHSPVDPDALHSFVWLLPSFGRPELRSACFGVTATRWRPAYHTKAVSGRRLCRAQQSHVATHTHDCTGSEAAQPAQRASDTIVVLAQNVAHSTYGRNSRRTLEDCLDLLYRNYRHVGSADVLLFHNGDFAPADQASLRRGRSNLYFELLADEYWRTPPYYFEHEKELKATKFALGYRHMIRWWARMVFQRAHALGYGWVMRMDDDSQLLSEVDYDLFAFMRSRQLQYGYRLVSCEPIKHGSYYRMLQRYVMMHQLPANQLGAHCSRSEPQHFGALACGRAVWGVYNNFFIANVSLWMDARVQRFLDYVDHTGVIYLYNWNDILWHTAVIKLFLPSDSVHHFRDFTYRHATLKPPRFQRVSWGLMQAGTRDPNGSRAVADWASRYRLAPVFGKDGTARAGYNNCPAEYN